jgi:hypothetical protein
MFNDIKVIKIEAINGCTRIRIDLKNKDTDDEYTVLIKTTDLFKELNNKLHEQFDKQQEEKGWRSVNEVEVKKKDFIK